MKKCIKSWSLPLKTSTSSFSSPWWTSHSVTNCWSLPTKPSMFVFRVGNHVHVKKPEVAQGKANARPPDRAKFANASPPGLTMRANAPQLPGGNERSWNWLMHKLVSEFLFRGLNIQNIFPTRLHEVPFRRVRRESHRCNGARVNVKMGRHKHKHKHNHQDKKFPFFSCLCLPVFTWLKILCFRLCVCLCLCC